AYVKLHMIVTIDFYYLKEKNSQYKKGKSIFHYRLGTKIRITNKKYTNLPNV
ncbi:hypothetical protein L9F63_025279, partial [Diploptera punctata]